MNASNERSLKPMPAAAWDSLHPMPPGRDFEAYRHFNRVWNNFLFHSHPFFEFFFFINGSISIMAEEKRFQIQPWDMFIFPPGVMHRNTPVGENINYERAYFYVTENFVRSVSEPECSLADILHYAVKNKQYHFHLGEEAGKEMMRKLDGVIGMADRPGATAQLINRCQMTILLASVCEILRDSNADPSSATEAKAAQVLRYINLHFADPISLDTLAGQFYLSKYHLLREFKDYTGTTIHQYLIQKRIVYAQLLLQQGAMPMQAANACGFSDYPCFFRTFKRLTGLSPKQYAGTQGRVEAG